MSLSELKKWPELLVFLLTVLVAILRLQSLPDYPIHDDELITLDLLKSIKNTGLPLLNGKTYWRAPVAHYLMAIPGLFQDITLVSARIVPVLSSALALPYCYRIGRELAGPLAGILAAVFLAFSTYENLYAAFARFYMPFQFFFIASLWYAYLLFAKKQHDKVFLWLLFSIAAIGSHRLGIMLWPAFLLTIFMGRDLRLLANRKLWAASLVLLAWSYLVCFWTPQGAYSSKAVLNLSIGYLKDKMTFVNMFRIWIPFAIALWILSLLPLVRQKGAWAFCACVFFGGVLIISLLAPADNPRYVLHLYPLGVILASASLAWWLQCIRNFVCQPREVKWSKRTISNFIFLGLLLFAMVWFDNKNVASAFGTSVTFANQQPAHTFLTKNLRGSDIVLSVDPGITRYYLGDRNVLFLREKLDIETGAYSPYDESVKQGAKNGYVDSTQALQKLLANFDDNIWLYANNKIKWAISLETDALIREKFDLVYKFEDTWVLVSRPHKR